MLRILWGITGSGDRIEEILNAMLTIHSKTDARVDVIVSRAGEQVWRRYALWDRLNESFPKVMKETNANVPFVAGPLQIGKYDLLIIAPLTANSTAKIAYGIADTLVTNAVAQTLKGTTAVIVYPVDQKPGQVEIISPEGIKSAIKTREIDLQNASRLREMEGITVVALPSEIPEKVAIILSTK